jgi:hypothetical protein
MSISIDTETRETVAAYLVAQLEQATPVKRERIIRLLVNRLPRYTIDGLFISMALVEDASLNEHSTKSEETS